MKLFETSLLEFMCQPLRLFKSVYQYYGGRLYSEDLFEHVFTGVIIACLLRHFPWFLPLIGYGIFGLIHIVAKELIYDVWIKKKPLNKVDFITRSYGFCLGALVLI